MRKKRMKKTEDEIGRQSTSLNFLRVRERKRKGIKRRYWGTFIMTRTTTGWLWCNIRTFNRKRHRRQQTAAALVHFLLLTLPVALPRVLICMSGGRDVFYIFQFFLYSAAASAWFISCVADTFRIFLFSYFLKNLFVN